MEELRRSAPLTAAPYRDVFCHQTGWSGPAKTQYIIFQKEIKKFCMVLT